VKREKGDPFAAPEAPLLPIALIITHLKMFAKNSWFYCRLGWGDETQQPKSFVLGFAIALPNLQILI